ncbi:alpha-soluble NSF attachment protein [Marchantia polymorpha subsp. ruderalis]|uniref:Uncharacterized protein n=2 Tax=Marchantia polymorpha TaxID=3197 RepID=A0AAF6B0P7_MARPO|nr:hypothetical protein MARPO_0004s0238 [Marchantia polymorpha]PTQ49002.1 hypothetical protein MARPO_0004s0238 [Marchantia polymorpha]BBN05580.1 hypothetical protein Mp_3g14330 [Marchantia polymorpha subsp. ruderalis]BBN05581.1 hypothetical protein Mp_3g14330 [Marchantia polymorpha subsp. ruderalis]|eukprot:PTQ49001.1 hypothetical protein MARPO_0004s0238 [Marchantia polymorpha]
MGDLESQGNEFEQKAEKKLKGWGIFGSKYDDAAELLEKAGNSYKLAKAWDKAAAVYIKLANCHAKLESKHEAATAFVDAANCYKKTQPQEAIKALNTGVALYMEIGRLSMAAKYLKDIGDIYGKEEDAQKAMDYYEKAADLYSGEEANSTGNQCRLKVAEYAAELEQYPKAIEIYEVVARQSLDSNLLKYSVKGYLLNAGLCHLCGSDIVAIHNALEKYQDLDPTFSNTRECKFLADLAAAIDEEDVGKFTDVVKEFDSMSRLDQWKTMLLLRAKNALKAKEMEEDELT